MGAAEVASVTPAPDEAALAAAHEQMLRVKGLQFDFTVIEQPEPPDWLDDVAKVFEAIAPVLQWIFWIGLAAVAALVVFFIVRELMSVRFRRRPKAHPAVVEDWRPEPARARALLEDADRLAAEGRFDEAVRLILHRSIDDFADRRPGAIRPALTSRDIAGLGSMPAAARDAFDAIARAVESSFFAARPAAAADFSRCRQAYERFAFPQVWA